MRRAFGVAAGVLNHVLFGVTVMCLYRFLSGQTGPARPPEGFSVAVDLLAAAQFSVAHSVLLWPGTREWITRLIPGAFYGTLFCALTCADLLLTISVWRPLEPVLMDLTGPVARGVELVFLGTWGLLIYSLSLSGAGHQTGFTSWWCWVRRRPVPRREFVPRGLYRWFRHPIYFSFLGLLWLTPRITLDRALLIGTWTVYIFVGSVLKDRRLVHYLGHPYQVYQSRVRGYPLIGFGPLGRVPLPGSGSPETGPGWSDTTPSGQSDPTEPPALRRAA